MPPTPRDLPVWLADLTADVTAIRVFAGTKNNLAKIGEFEMLVETNVDDAGHHLRDMDECSAFADRLQSTAVEGDPDCTVIKLQAMVGARVSATITRTIRDEEEDVKTEGMTIAGALTQMANANVRILSTVNDTMQVLTGVISSLATQLVQSNESERIAREDRQGLLDEIATNMIGQPSGGDGDDLKERGLELVEKLFEKVQSGGGGGISKESFIAWVKANPDKAKQWSSDPDFLSALSEAANHKGGAK